MDPVPWKGTHSALSPFIFLASHRGLPQITAGSANRTHTQNIRPTQSLCRPAPRKVAGFPLVRAAWPPRPYPLGPESLAVLNDPKSGTLWASWIKHKLISPSKPRFWAHSLQPLAPAAVSSAPGGRVWGTPGSLKESLLAFPSGGPQLPSPGRARESLLREGALTTRARLEQAGKPHRESQGRPQRP